MLPEGSTCLSMLGSISCCTHLRGHEGRIAVAAFAVVEQLILEAKAHAPTQLRFADGFLAHVLVVPLYLCNHGTI